MKEQPTFEPRDIVLGPRAGAWYIVREGLTEGELVVTHGSFKIDSELQIRGRPSMMQPEGGAPPTHDHGDTAANQPSLPPETAQAPSQTPPRSEAVQAPSQFQTQIGRIVTSNFDLVDALAADDPEAARRAALQTDEALHRVDPTTLTNNLHRQQWNRLAKNLHDPIVQLANNEDLKEQRRLFKSFSDALIEAVRTFGVARTGEVYLVMCPMVEGGEGYWLQPQKDITNPYLGSMMLTCGEIMETIVQPDEHSGGHG
jgi:membrane fusion protein, copper/silver efflux system